MIVCYTQCTTTVNGHTIWIANPSWWHTHYKLSRRCHKPFLQSIHLNSVIEFVSYNNFDVGCDGNSSNWTLLDPNDLISYLLANFYPLGNIATPHGIDGSKWCVAMLFFSLQPLSSQEMVLHELWSGYLVCWCLAGEDHVVWMCT